MDNYVENLNNWTKVVWENYNVSPLVNDDLVFACMTRILTQVSLIMDNIDEIDREKLKACCQKILKNLAITLYLKDISWEELI